MDFITVHEIQTGTKAGQSICLNMIVKNESHIIGETLENLTSYFNFSYWVISDTGSTDNTIEIIEAFFKTKNIPGEIHRDEWCNFGHNRTVALNHAYKKSDYILIFDADDKIYGKLVLPDKLTDDSYSLMFGSANDFTYHRPLLINNHAKWQYIGVVHEYLDSCGSSATKCILNGDYNIVSGRSGNRNNDPQKYLKDANILEKAYNELIENKDNEALRDRYAFYCANSFFDYGDFETASKWYKLTLSRNNWDQEKFMCCYKLYKCYKKMQQMEVAQFYLVKSFYYDKDRTECAHKLITYYYGEQQYEIAYAYYSVIKNYYESKYLEDTCANKLFMDNRVSNFFLPYHMIIISDKVKQFETMAKMFQIIFLKRVTQIPAIYISTLLYNFQFVLPMLNDIVKSVPDFVQHIFELFNDYIKFSIENKYDVIKYDFWGKYEQLEIPIITQILSMQQQKKHVQQEVLKEPVLQEQPIFASRPVKFDTSCKSILIFAGFGNIKWNYTYGTKNALGGSERAVNYLAAAFPKGYKVFISGNVEEETIDNVEYINLSKLGSLISQNTFHTIIVSRYISFYEIFPHAKSFQSFIWVHDTSVSSYGCNLSEHNILEKHDSRIDGVVCLTEWHKTHIGDKYPSLKPKIQIINNGIALHMFSEPSNIKPVKNRFVYTSCPERGLERLLQLWPEILKNIPTAELKISSYNNFPCNADDERMLKIIKQYPSSIQHCGKLSQVELYNLMEYAEYWLYPSNWPETSCITAIEMMRSGVLCLYYPWAGLPYTMNGHGIKMNPNEEITALMALHNSSQEVKGNMISQGIEYANSCSWNNRALIWDTMLQGKVQQYKNYHKCIKIINLERRLDRKTQITAYMKEANVQNYEFIKAVDGKELKPTLKIKELFLGNDFNYRKGVIGCALSHIYLWEALLADDMNEYYVIIEDDAKLCKNFKANLDCAIDLYISKKVDYLLIGGQKINEECVMKEELQVQILKHTITAYTTIGYIINKSACKKLLQYINVYHVTRAIDWVGIYSNAGVIMWAVNKWLVDAPTFQINNNQDTDIQKSYDAFDFTALENATNTIRVAYTDWWISEYCGGDFDKHNNFLITIIKKYASQVSKSVVVVEHNEEPTILFYSLFGNTHDKYINNPNIRCIFYSGEPYSARPEASHNFTFDKTSINLKNTRLPLWLMYDNSKLIQLSNDRKNGIFEKVDKKERFCSCIVSNNGNEIRRNIVETLSTYKRVDCGGAFLNNLGYTVPKGMNCSGKIDHNKHYKFVLALENKDYPGYCTEKLADAYKSGSLPIYWGNNDVIQDFNPNTFINVNDFASIRDLVEHIVKVDNDDALYESYFKEPIFTESWLNILNNTNNAGDTFYKGFFDNMLGNHVATFESENKKETPFVSIYNVWHHKLFDDMYINLDDATLQKIVMYGVNASYPKEYNANKQYNILYEYDLKCFNGSLQDDGYCQTSAFYHIFLNNLHANSKHVGFIQYDMKIGKNMIEDIEFNIAESGNNVIFYHFHNDALYTFQTDYGSHGLCQPYDNSVLEQYNKYFNTNYTLDALLTHNDTCKVILLHTFVIPKEMFAKMMGWFNNIFDWLHVNVQNKYYKSDRASFTEKMFALFLYIEQIEQPTIKLVEMSIEHIWPMLHNQTSWENYKKV